MLKQLTDSVDKGIIDFNNRSAQAIDVFNRMPQEFEQVGANLMQYQLAEFRSATFGQATSAIDCTAENVQQRCIQNLTMIKNALKKAADRVNELEKEFILQREGQQMERIPCRARI